MAMANPAPHPAPLEMATPEAHRAAAGGWGSLQEDLLGCIAALLPLRERWVAAPAQQALPWLSARVQTG